MPTNKTAAIASTQKYLNILAIRDGMVVLQDGAIRTILKVGSLNFALKSEDEQNGIIYSYQQFLNSLKFPIQIVMQSRRLDLFGYLKMLRELLEKQTNDLIRIQTEEYINFIERLLTKANIMDKTFYVVVPFFPGGIQKVSMLDKVLGGGGKSGAVHYTKEQFQEFKTQLDERVNVISGGLGSMGLKVQPLNTQEIIELLYGVYNPAEAISERMTEVSNLESPVVKTDLPAPKTDKNTNETIALKDKQEEKQKGDDRGQADGQNEATNESMSNPSEQESNVSDQNTAQGAADGTTEDKQVAEILSDMPVTMEAVPEAEQSPIATPSQGGGQPPAISSYQGGEVQVQQANNWQMPVDAVTSPNQTSQPIDSLSSTDQPDYNQPVPNASDNTTNINQQGE